MFPLRCTVSHVIPFYIHNTLATYPLLMFSTRDVAVRRIRYYPSPGWFLRFSAIRDFNLNNHRAPAPRKWGPEPRRNGPSGAPGISRKGEPNMTKLIPLRLGIKDRGPKNTDQVWDVTEQGVRLCSTKVPVTIFAEVPEKS